MKSKYKVEHELVSGTMYYVIYKREWFLFIPYYSYYDLSATKENALDKIRFLQQSTIYV